MPKEQQPFGLGLYSKECKRGEDKWDRHKGADSGTYGTKM